MTTVFIVDDHDLFRAGVRAELPADLEVIGDAPQSPWAVRVIRTHVMRLEDGMGDVGGAQSGGPCVTYIAPVYWHNPVTDHRNARNV